MSRDKFEAMADRMFEKCPEAACADPIEFAARLLQREHTALVRAVRLKRDAQLPAKKNMLEYDRVKAFQQGYTYACNDVLALLAARKGRK